MPDPSTANIIIIDRGGNRHKFPPGTDPKLAAVKVEDWYAHQPQSPAPPLEGALMEGPGRFPHSEKHIDERAARGQPAGSDEPGYTGPDTFAGGWLQSIKDQVKDALTRGGVMAESAAEPHTTGDMLNLVIPEAGAGLAATKKAAGPAVEGMGDLLVKGGQSKTMKYGSRALGVGEVLRGGGSPTSIAGGLATSGIPYAVEKTGNLLQKTGKAMAGPERILPIPVPRGTGAFSTKAGEEPVLREAITRSMREAPRPRVPTSGTLAGTDVPVEWPEVPAEFPRGSSGTPADPAGGLPKPRVAPPSPNLSETPRRPGIPDAPTEAPPVEASPLEDTMTDMADDAVVDWEGAKGPDVRPGTGTLYEDWGPPPEKKAPPRKGPPGTRTAEEMLAERDKMRAQAAADAKARAVAKKKAERPSSGITVEDPTEEFPRGRSSPFASPEEAAAHAAEANGHVVESPEGPRVVYDAPGTSPTPGATATRAGTSEPAPTATEAGPSPLEDTLNTLSDEAAGVTPEAAEPPIAESAEPVPDVESVDDYTSPDDIAKDSEVSPVSSPEPAAPEGPAILPEGLNIDGPENIDWPEVPRSSPWGDRPPEGRPNPNPPEPGDILGTTATPEPPPSGPTPSSGAESPLEGNLFADIDAAAAEENAAATGKRAKRRFVAPKVREAGPSSEGFAADAAAAERKLAADAAARNGPTRQPEAPGRPAPRAPASTEVLQADRDAMGPDAAAKKHGLTVEEFNKRTRPRIDPNTGSKLLNDKVQARIRDTMSTMSPEQMQVYLDSATGKGAPMINFIKSVIRDSQK